MRRFLARLTSLFRTRAAEHELAREIESHLVLMQDDFERRGLTPADARAAARRAYGGVEQAKELHREARSMLWLDHRFRDLRYGWRTLMRTPGFTAVAVITLALGIGANTAMFSVFNAVLLRRLPYRDADRLVTILHEGTDPVAIGNYIDWRDQSHSFQTMAAAEYWTPNLTGGDAPEHLFGLRLTQNLLPMLGVEPMLGRVFTPGEDQKGAEHEVVLSHALWQRRFNSDRAILGRSMILDGESYTVVGVMPAGFRFAPFWATRAELWAPLAFGNRIHDRGGNSLRVFARLKPGVSLAQARADVATITGRLERQFPGSNRGVVVRPLKENVVGNVETPLMILLGAVAFVLLIACANVAHMLLARTSDRQREIAVRAAIGAGRARVIGQLLTENLLLAFIGAGVGLVLAVWATRSLTAFMPGDMPGLQTVSVDGRVVLFLLATTILTAVAFGLAPAMHAATGNLSGALKEGGRTGTDGARRSRVRSLLVGSEFALAFALLVAAGLMVRSFTALQTLDPGFNPHHVLSMVVSVAGSAEAEPGRRAAFYREILDQVRAIPGVESAGVINHAPIGGDIWAWPFLIEGRPKPRPGESPFGVYRIVMPGYFETMRLPLRRGRLITGLDDSRAPGVLVINERAANLYWPGQNPIGKRITFDTGSRTPTWLTVVGVVKDAKQSDWAAAPYPEVYLAALQNREFLESAQAHLAYITLMVRTAGDPVELAPAIKKVVWRFDRNLPISEVLTMDKIVETATAQPRFEMFLLALFAAVALVLAAVGIYGVMNYSVSRRTHEIGIRMSLGASRMEVLRMVIRQGATQVIAGAAVGLVGALLLSRLMASMLYGVRPADPVTFASVALVLGVVALLAICIPARRATRIEPMIALRNE